MRVLVTGHQGYIGTVMTPMLTAAGHDVVGLDSGLFNACTFLPAPTDIETINKDIRDVDSDMLDGFEAVIHLAGLSNDPLGNLDPALTHEINYVAAAQLAHYAKAAGVRRFLFASSCSNYGASGNDWLTEDAVFNPVTPYARSKVDAEQAIRRLANESFSPTVLRMATAYGVSPRLRFDLVVNNLVAYAQATGKVLLKSDGSAWRPLVHVEDIARAFCAVLSASDGCIHNQYFNVGRNDDNYRVRDVAEFIQAVVPDCQIVFAEGAGADLRSYRVDCQKILTTLPAFIPTWSVKSGIAHICSTFADAELSVVDFEGARFQRLAHLESLLKEKRIDQSLRWIN